MLRSILLALCLLPVATVPVSASDRVLTVTGVGQVTARPDIATIRIGVETRGRTAEDALSENSARAAALIQTAQKAGVAGRDIQTSGLSIFPLYDQRSSNSRETPPITGYAVNNEVTLRLRDVGTLGQTLGDLVKAGANQMRGINFGIEDDTALLDAARKAAVADARRKAEAYAEAAGVTLGPVLSISEGGGGQSRGPALRSMAEAVPVEAGETALSASVRMEWAIK